MGKKSTKENKTKYHLVREELGWSREYASEQMGMITPERLERIENEKVTPDPKEILVMAETYDGLIAPQMISSREMENASSKPVIHRLGGKRF